MWSKLLILNFWSSQCWMILKKKRSFFWFLSNSEVEATWTSLIGWPHKTSSESYVLNHGEQEMTHFKKLLLSYGFLNINNIRYISNLRITWFQSNFFRNISRADMMPNQLSFLFSNSDQFLKKYVVNVLNFQD